MGEHHLGDVVGILLRRAPVLPDEPHDLLEASDEPLLLGHALRADRKDEQPQIVFGDHRLERLGVDRQRFCSRRFCCRRSNASAIRCSWGSPELRSGRPPALRTKAWIFGQSMSASSSLISIRVESMASWISLSTCFVTDFERTSNAF